MILGYTLAVIVADGKTPMNIDFDDDEILADFLMEAGEIIDQLGGQLVELEKAPWDVDLLNEIFRGFHTIKGGAGFLSLTTLVDVCRGAEEVFSVLRQGIQPLTAGLMDALLLVLDDIKAQFAVLQAHSPPAPAGITITGDGGVALILDKPGLTHAFLDSAGAVAAADPRVQAVA